MPLPLMQQPEGVLLDSGHDLAQWQELQHFAEIGRLSASLLHEISNPLTAAMLHLEMVDPQSPAIRRAKRDMRLLRRYIEAARQQVRQQSKPVSFMAGPQLEQLKRVVLPLARRAGVNLRMDPTPDCRLFGDPVKFQQLTANLIINAIEAYDDPDNRHQAMLVEVKVSCTPHWLIIEVADWGRGITATELPKLFEPFYTTKDDAGHGLGIGLALVKRYVTLDFCGSIKVSSTKRLGTRFTIKLRTLPL